MAAKVSALGIATALSFYSGTVPAQQGQTAPNKRELTIKQVKELPAKSKRFALIIGIDEYQDTQITSLEGAANDAKALAEALVQYAGFPRDQVILLASDQPIERRPLRGNILQYLSNLKGIVPEDGLLLVSFAGHGIERGGRGFLCPTDARIGGSIMLLEATAVPIDTVRDWIRDTGVKQVLIILDACRNNPSGRGEGDAKLTESFAQQFNFAARNKEVIAFATLYATDVGNIAYEYKEKKQGYFTWALVEGLKGAAANEKGEVTLAGLRNYLQEIVPKRVRLDLGPEKKQRPYAVVEGYKAEELVLSISAHVTAVDSSAASAPDAGIEVKLWDAVKDSKDPDDYKAYLARYPRGVFSGVALNRVRNLESPASLSAQPKNEPKSTETKTADSNAGSATVVVKRPYDKERLLKVVELNALPTGEVVQAINQRGVEFQMTPDIESQFRVAGARSEVIEAVRSNYRPVLAAPDALEIPKSAARPSAKLPADPPLSKSEIMTDYDDLTDKAVAAMQANNTAMAVRLLQQAVNVDASKPQAYGLLGFAQLYGNHDMLAAERSMRTAIERGGSAPFRVYHDHDGFFNTFCQGSLLVSRTSVIYRADDGIHEFKANRRDVKEVKLNGFVGAQYGAFHLRGAFGADKGSTHNFAPSTKQKSEANLVISLINSYQ